MVILQFFPWTLYAISAVKGIFTRNQGYWRNVLKIADVYLLIDIDLNDLPADDIYFRLKFADGFSVLDQYAVAVVSRLIIDEGTERSPVIFELFQFLVPLPVGIQDIFKPDIFALRNLIEILNPPVLDDMLRHRFQKYSS